MRRPHCFGYVRVSTERQADSENGLNAQRDCVLKYYESNLKDKYEWGGIFEDPGISAQVHLFRRPYGSILNLQLEPGDMVLMTKIDRGFRSVVDFYNTITRWREQGVHLCFAKQNFNSDTPLGKMVLGILVAFSEWERDIIQERTQESVDIRRAMGLSVGGKPPYGKKYVKQPDGKFTIEDDPDERNAGKLVFLMRKNKASLAACAHALNSRGVKTRWGNEYDQHKVHRLIRLERRELQREAEARLVGKKGKKSADLVDAAPDAQAVPGGVVLDPGAHVPGALEQDQPLPHHARHHGPVLEPPPLREPPG